MWGTSYGVTKEVLAVYPVLAFLVLRFSLTTLLLTIPLLQELRKNWILIIRVGVPTGLILFAIFLCEIFGILYTSASNAAVLISLFVVFTPLVEWVVFRKPPPTRIFVLSIISVGGVLLLTEGASVSFNRGDALILAAAFLRACMVTATSGLSRKYSGSTIAMTAMQSLVVAVGAVVAFFIVAPEDFFFPQTVTNWALIFYLVVFCTIFAFFAQNYASRRSNPSRVSLLMGTEPVFGALFAIAWLNESISLQGWVGLSIIIISCLCISKRQTTNE